MARKAAVLITKDNLRSIVNAITGQLNLSLVSEEELEQIFRKIEDSERYELDNLLNTMREVILETLQKDLPI